MLLQTFHDRLETAGQDIDQLCINTIRTLAMDAVQKANSGHPGAPMALAPVVYCLVAAIPALRPDHPIWPNRDRFVLSAGHASMLLYCDAAPDRRESGESQIRDARASVGVAGRHQALSPARQQMSRSPGIPLDLGRRDDDRPAGARAWPRASAWPSPRVGARATFNRPGFELFDYDVYALCGDGCMMEGISGEAASLAGHLKLANLCWIYDNNHITIEGNTALDLQR